MKTAMKVWMVCGVMGWYVASAQNPEEEVLKKIALQETEAFRNRDFDLWKSLYIQDEKTTITISGKDVYEDYVGWRAIDSGLALLGKTPLAKANILQMNIYIEIGDRMAWMRYDQEVTIENNFKSPFVNRVFITFEKQDGLWKIRSYLFIQSSTYKAFRKR